MPTHGSWETIELAGHVCHVYQPSQPSPHGYVVLYLHDASLKMPIDHPAECAALDAHGLRAICPVTGRSWWTDRICDEFDSDITAERYVLDCVLPYIAQRWSSHPPQLALLGTRMGGQGALRFAYKYPDLFPVVAAITPAVDYHLRLDEPEDQTLAAMYADPEEARQDTALLHVHPLNWPRHQFFCCDPLEYWWDSADRLAMKLSSLGIPFERDLETSTDGDRHAYTHQMAERAVGFIAERLNQERLRLPIG
jgi:hypothetical protein